MLYTAITLLGSENWHDAIEDGAVVRDVGSLYDPSAGFDFRKTLLDDLNKIADVIIMLAEDVEKKRDRLNKEN